MRFTHLFTMAAVALVAALPASAQSSFPRRYAISAEFPAPAALPDAVAYRLNNLGQTAGRGIYTKGTTTRLVFIEGRLRFVTLPVERSTAVGWTASGQPTLLKPLSTNAATSISDINDSGWVVGDAFKSATAATGYAVVWRDGKVTDLGAGLGSNAQHINAQGWIMGYRPLSSSNPTRRIFLWRNNRVEQVPAVPGSGAYDGAFCVGLSDTGLIPCMHSASSIDGLVSHAFVWRNGVHEELLYPNAQAIWVSAVSHNGIVAGLLKLNGDITTYGFPERPYLWRDGQFTLLPRVPTGMVGSIIAVSNQGTLLVDLTAANVNRQAVWTATGEVIDPLFDLNVVSGDTVVRIHDINENGQLLAAVKRGAAGVERQVLLTAIARDPMSE